MGGVAFASEGENDPRDISNSAVYKAGEIPEDENLWNITYCTDLHCATIPVGTADVFAALDMHLYFAEDDAFDEEGDIADPSEIIKTLTYGTDYELAGWANDKAAAKKGQLSQTPPTKIGTYYCVLRGIGDYHGRSVVHFRIIAASKGETLEAPAADYTILNSSKRTVAYKASGYKKAASLSVPDTVKIGDKTYKVTSIKAKAFAGTAATSIKVGKNVSKIAANAFAGSKAKTLTIKNAAKPTKAMFAKGCFAKSNVKTIKVPAKRKAAYKRLLTKKYTGTKAAKITIK